LLLSGDISWVRSNMDDFRFVAGDGIPSVYNTYEAGISSGASQVRFTIGGQSAWDRDGSDGWSAEFDMSACSGGSNLVVQSYSGTMLLDSYSRDVNIIMLPEWFSSDDVSYEVSASPSSGYQFEVQLKEFDFGVSTPSDWTWGLDGYFGGEPLIDLADLYTGVQGGWSFSLRSHTNGAASVHDVSYFLTMDVLGYRIADEQLSLSRSGQSLNANWDYSDALTVTATGTYDLSFGPSIGSDLELTQGLSAYADLGIDIGAMIHTPPVTLVGIPVVGDLSLSVGVGIDIGLDVDTVMSWEPGTGVSLTTATVYPHMDVRIAGSVEGSVAFGAAKAGITLYADLEQGLAATYTRSSTWRYSAPGSLSLGGDLYWDTWLSDPGGTALFNKRIAQWDFLQNTVGTGDLDVNKLPGDHPNTKPYAPEAVSPSNGASGQSLTPTLRSSSFSDPDAGDSHRASWWQISTNPNFPSSGLTWEYISDTDLTSVTVPQGVLSYRTRYYWRVGYQDSKGEWGDGSGPGVYFRTEGAPQRVLQSLSIEGSSEVSEEWGAIYHCMAHYSDGSTEDVSSSAFWNVDNASYASIGITDGYNSATLRTQSVDSNVSCQITATYAGLEMSVGVVIESRGTRPAISAFSTLSGVYGTDDQITLTLRASDPDGYITSIDIRWDSNSDGIFDPYNDEELFVVYGDWTSRSEWAFDVQAIDYPVGEVTFYARVSDSGPSVQSSEWHSWSVVISDTQVACPVILPGSGTFVAPVHIAMEAESGATIRYTTDGTIPTVESPIYVGEFVVEAATTVRARAFKPRCIPSGVSATTISFTSPPAGESFRYAQSYFANYSDVPTAIGVSPRGKNVYLKQDGTVFVFDVDGTLRDTLVLPGQSIRGYSNSIAVNGETTDFLYIPYVFRLGSRGPGVVYYYDNGSGYTFVSSLYLDVPFEINEGDDVVLDVVLHPDQFHRFYVLCSIPSRGVSVVQEYEYAFGSSYPELRSQWIPEEMASAPVDLAFSRDESEMYLLSSEEHKVYRYYHAISNLLGDPSRNGTYLGVFDLTAASICPISVYHGGLFAADSENGRVQAFWAGNGWASVWDTVFGGDMASPSAIASTPSLDTVYVWDNGNLSCRSYAYLPTPMINLQDGGVYVGPQEVQIISPRGYYASDWDVYDEIRYTVDGTVPTTSSSLYSGQFVMDRSGTIMARGFMHDGTHGDVAVAEVTITSPLASIVISGPSRVNEQDGVQYSCTAVHEDGSSIAVTESAAWSVTSVHAQMGADGSLSALGVLEDTQCVVKATFGGRTATYSVTLVNSYDRVISLTVSGPSVIQENGYYQFGGEATLDNGTSKSVTDMSGWHFSTADAAFNGNGLLATGAALEPVEGYVFVEYGGVIATHAVVIYPMNTPPMVAPQTATTNEDTQTVVVLLGEDKETEPLAYIVSEHPSHGAVIIQDGQAVYLPEEDYSGIDSFSVISVDGGYGPSPCLSSDPATVTITVNPVNDQPTANVQSITTIEGIAKVIMLTGSDLETPTGDLAYTIETEPSHGTVTLSGNEATYTPTGDYNGSDSFTFAVTDTGEADSPALASAPATVSVTVDPVNDAPSFAKGSDQTVEEDAGPQSVANWATNISPGAADESDQAASFAVTSDSPGLFAAGPAISSNGRLTYTPADDANGSAVITVVAKDDGGTANGGVDTSAPQTFRITINSVNDVPVAAGESYSVSEDGTLDGSTVLANDSDLHSGAPDESNLPLTAQLVDDVTHGTLVLASDGTFTYEPYDNFNGPDSFTYQAVDSLGGVSNTATVSITVSPVNDRPAANGQSITTDEDTPTAVTLSGSDLETPAGSLTYSVTQPSHGTVSVAGRVATYMPAANYSGPDSFTFTVTDDGDPAGSHDNPANQTSDVAIVNLNVLATNDRPTATAQTVQMQGDSGVEIVLAGVDVETAIPDLVYTISRHPSHGTLTRLGEGQYRYEPAANSDGTDSFEFTVTDDGDPAGSDNDLTSQPATVSIISNQRPVLGQFSVLNKGGFVPRTGWSVGYRASGLSDSDGSITRLEVYADTNGSGTLETGADRLLHVRTFGQGQVAPWYGFYAWMDTPASIGWGTGNHLIFGRVADNEGGWSDPVSATVRVVDLVTIGSKSVQTHGGNQKARRAPARFTDPDGTGVSISLKGYGVVGVTLGADGYVDRIEVAEWSDGRAALTIVTDAGGDGGTEVGRIVSSTSLGKITGKRVDLVGDGIAFTDGRYVGSIQVRDIKNGADVVIPGSAPKGVQIRAGVVHAGADVVLGSHIKKLTAIQWAGSSLTAPWASNISIMGNGKEGFAGDLAADLTFTDSDPKTGLSLKKLKVAGRARGVTVRGQRSLGTILVGTLEGSDLLAGIADGVTRSADTQGDFDNLAATIKSVKVVGPKMPKGQIPPRWFFQDSNISAATIGSVRLLNVDFQNNDTLFGLWACGLGAGGKIKSVRWADRVDKTVKGMWPPKKGEVLDEPGDLAIRII